MNARRVTVIKNGKTTVYQSIAEAAPHLGRHPQTYAITFPKIREKPHTKQIRQL